MATFTTPMPERPPRQKHAKPKRSDNYGFLKSLRGNQAADVNLQWKWNDLHDRTKAGGGEAFGMHWPDPRRNGYTRITYRRSGHLLTRRMTRTELHRQNWTVHDVRRWRRGRTRFSPAPRSYAALCRYVKKRGGVIVGELKSQTFRVEWVMAQLVAEARQADHPPFFKALFNMKFAEEKCAATVKAGGQFALIFGSRVRGRKARLTKGQQITAGWAVPPTRIW